MHTSKRLYLLRHGKSSWDAAVDADFDRPLATRGRKASTAIGKLLKREGLQPDLVLCSAAVRTRETWQRVAAELPQEPPVKLLRSLYLAAPSRLIERIHAVEEVVATLLLVGHNPGMQHLAALLAGPGSDRAALERLQARFPTAALACFELEGPWSGTGSGAARLVSFITPKELD